MEPGIVSGRVAVLLRFAEVNPEFFDFIYKMYICVEGQGGFLWGVEEDGR